MHIESHAHISEYTYGPGYYTRTVFGSFFASEKWGFELLYRKFIEDYFYQLHEDEIAYREFNPSKIAFEAKERSVLSASRIWDGKEMVRPEWETKIRGTRLIASYRNRNHNSVNYYIEFKGLNTDGTRDRGGEITMRQKFLERLTA